MYHNFFIRSSVHGHLGCFHILAIVNSTTMNSGIHVFFFNPGFLREWELLGPMVVLFLVFKGISIPSSIVADGHSDQCEVISHRGFDLHFSYNERC